MTFKSLLDAWAAEQAPTRTSETYEIRLATEDAARVHALADLFPGVSHERVITDLGLLNRPEFNPSLREPEEGFFSFLAGLNPMNWAEGVAADQYYKRGGSIGGLLQPAPTGFEGAGAALGRAQCGLVFLGSGRLADSLCQPDGLPGLGIYN